MNNIKNKSLDQDAFITLLAEKARFTKSDVKLIYDAMVEVFEQSVKEDTELRLRSFGKLYISHIPVRIGIGGKLFPPAKKVIFRLAENIRGLAQSTNKVERGE